MKTYVVDSCVDLVAGIGFSGCLTAAQPGGVMSRSGCCQGYQAPPCQLTQP